MFSRHVKRQNLKSLSPFRQESQIIDGQRSIDTLKKQWKLSPLNQSVLITSPGMSLLVTPGMLTCQVTWGSAINVWIGHKIDNVSHQNAAWTYSGDARRAGVGRLTCQSCLESLSINFNFFPLTEPGSRIWRFAALQSQSPSSEGLIPLLTGPCTLNNFSQCVFVCNSFGWIIYCNNECLWWWEHIRILIIGKLSTLTLLLRPLICEYTPPLNSIITDISQLLHTANFKTLGMGK